MEIKNGIIIDGMLYECVQGQGDDVSLRKIGKVKDILIHGAIDLGLSVKWADRNIGAEEPSDYGDYFAWGEIEPKSAFTRENSRLNADSNCGWGISGDPKYDAARAKWGGTWHLPTRSEIDELIEKCTWKWTTQGGHNGYKVTGPNGNSIFLPAAGYYEGMSFHPGGGSYWSASIYVGASFKGDYDAYHLSFLSTVYSRSWWGRGYNHGRSIRPVTK